jgi:nucleoside-diphosphate-sugar epimerase
MTVMIAGAGYLGAALAALLLDRGYAVVALENGFSTNLAALGALQRRGLVIVQGDLRDAAACRRALDQCDPLRALFLLAAQASAAYAAEHPDETEDINLRGPRVLLDALLACSGPLPPVIFGSSLKVCGPCLRGDIDDNAPYGPCTDLSHLSKIYVEKLLELYAQRAGLVAWSVRLPVLHGVSPVMKRDPRFQTVLNRFCAQAAAGKPLQVHAGAADCFQGFLHVLDAAAALAWLVDQPAVPGHRTLVTPCEVLTVSEVATIVQQVAARHGLQVHIEGAGVSPAAVRPVVRPGLIPPSFLRRTVAESAQKLVEYFAGQQRDCVEGAEPG